jgi:hypothetical protein
VIHRRPLFRPDPEPTVAVTNPDLRQQIHELKLDVVTWKTESESRHREQMGAIDRLATTVRELREEVSDQGKTPRPVEQAQESPTKPGRWTLPAIPPGAGIQYALFVGAIVSGILGPIAAFYGGSSGGNTGATTAVEDAVELGEAVPVSTPAPVRVVPVPIPLPVPVVVPEPVEIPPAASRNDLLPRELP